MGPSGWPRAEAAPSIALDRCQSSRKAKGQGGSVPASPGAMQPGSPLTRSLHMASGA